MVLERKGSDLPLIFLELLLIAIAGFTGLMFYFEGNFTASVISFGLTLVFTWLILDRSVF
ncbi:MAG: hypothetical protein ACI8Z7_000458 [Candidatus Nanohaloarchaea archaeon]|jgi:hypothetical protein